MKNQTNISLKATRFAIEGVTIIGMIFYDNVIELTFENQRQKEKFVKEFNEHMTDHIDWKIRDASINHVYLMSAAAAEEFDS